jgi:hypothetical protein
MSERVPTSDSLCRVLYHVSEEPRIDVFEPRPPAPTAYLAERVVWAVDDGHLQNYLLPRDCPRVTFYALPGSDPRDVERLMGQTSARFVVAVESGWVQTILATRLFVYRLPPETFEPHDEGAGHYVSRVAVRPIEVTRIDDLLGALLLRDVELRITPSLWRLRDAVVASTLQFSCIRMRNALPR